MKVKALKQRIAESCFKFAAERCRRNDAGSGRNVLLLPPSDLGSIGDEAILLGTLKCLKEEGYSVRMISYGGDLSRYYSDYIDGVVDLKNYFHYGSVRNLVSFFRQARQCAFFIFVAADILDGYYSQTYTLRRLKLVELASRIGLKTGIVNFSFNASPDPKVVNFLKKMDPSVYMASRDGISQKRAQAMLRRDVRLSCDAAFLLEPQTGVLKEDPVLGWIKQQKASGKDIIGVNINWQSFSHVGGASIRDVVNIYRKSLEALLFDRPDAVVLFLPHDIRGENSDFVLTRKIMDTLDARFLDRVMCIPDHLRSFEIKYLCSFLSCCISGRLHLAIACLGMGRPVAAVSYQDKAEGIFELFGVPSLVMDPQRLLNEGLYPVLEDLLRNKESYSETIKSVLPEALALVRENYKFMYSQNRYVKYSFHT